MARAAKLKVFRMPVGFHDAYVAAPSQKAAAETWGASPDVFSRGEAEQVTDPALTEEPLARPGEVIKRLRGTPAEQIAALGPTGKPPKAVKSAPAAKRKAPPKPKPRPSRDALDEAETDLAEAEARSGAVLAEIAKREAALAREREAAERKQAEGRRKLEARLEKTRAAYEAAMRKWREAG
jgi:hypothetical protein